MPPFLWFIVIYVAVVAAYIILMRASNMAVERITVDGAEQLPPFRGDAVTYYTTLLSDRTLTQRGYDGALARRADGAEWEHAGYRVDNDTVLRSVHVEPLAPFAEPEKLPRRRRRGA
ncbi:MAG: hypothetical protein KF822_12425 [Steroidobacteraceae bacterium]|nr:hypothetical protein [Steroidobacteraceae bacterium]